MESRAKNLVVSMITLVIILTATSLSEKPVTIGSSHVEMRITGHSDENQIIYVPSNTEMQRAVVNFKTKEDRYGNRYLDVSGDFNITILVNVSSDVLILNDEQMTTQEPNTVYLNSSSLINSDNPIIKEVSKQIVGGSRTKLEAIRKLMLWTHDHVKYDDKYSSVFLSGVETLKIGKGVCDEYTNLYTSLARASGIPTRVVVGLVYSGSRWQLHAWAESLVSKTWISVDPTFAEMGQIDATHIVLYRGPDYPYYVSPYTRLVYSIEKKSFSEYDLNLSVNASVPSYVRSRQKFNVSLSIRNNENFIVTPTYLLQVTEGLVVANGPRKTIILKPGQHKTITWTIIAPYGERKEYYAEIVGPEMDKLFEIKVNRTTPSLEADVKIDDLFAYYDNGNAVINVDAINSGNVDLDGVRILASSPSIGVKEKEISLGVGERYHTEFVFPGKPGYMNIMVECDYGNKSQKRYISLFIPAKNKGENPLGGMIEYMSRNSVKLFIVIITTVVLFGILFFIILFNRKKIIFKEKDKWEKLLRMK